ncbi:MAG TPA: hypothetical protein VFM38_12395 [Candidatus Limnocylindrales bacterium]|nr:hypothetical protein [Candidatus Limnocylindrales bacterium]
MARLRIASMLVSVACATTLAGACSSGPSGSTTPGPSASAPTTEFKLSVVPEQPVGLTLPGEKFVFLASVSGSPADGPVTLSATAEGATVSVEPAAVAPGVVAEVTVIPNAVAQAETPVAVAFRAERAGVVATHARTITVQPGTDELQPEADLHLAPFLTWLAANRPELGITEDTTWEAVPGSWVLIVSHYLYFSDEWELDLDWHVMIAPDDWSRICLRKRWEETAPSLAFEISSVSGKTPVHEIAPPEAVWR